MRVRLGPREVEATIHEQRLTGEYVVNALEDRYKSVAPNWSSEFVPLVKILESRRQQLETQCTVFLGLGVWKVFVFGISKNVRIGDG